MKQAYNISNLSRMAYYCRGTLYEYELKERRLKKTSKENSEGNHTIYPEAENKYFFAFFTTLPITFIVISSLHFLVKDTPSAEFINSILLIINFIFSFIFSLYISNETVKKKQRELKNQEIEKQQSELNNIFEKLKTQYTQFYDKIDTIVKKREYIPIREHLDYYYHTNIAELNLVIQEILESVYPKKENTVISLSLDPAKSHFLKTEHIKLIEEYLKKVVEEKIRANIAEKIED